MEVTLEVNNKITSHPSRRWYFHTQRWAIAQPPNAVFVWASSGNLVHCNSPCRPAQYTGTFLLRWRRLYWGQNCSRAGSQTRVRRNTTLLIAGWKKWLVGHSYQRWGGSQSHLQGEQNTTFTQTHEKVTQAVQKGGVGVGVGVGSTGFLSL